MFTWALIVLLLVSLPSYQLIPFWSFWGLDFQNLYAFHHCGAWLTPYSVSGQVCGDALGRDMVYPPLLYFAFAWVKLFPFSTALWIWTVTAIAIATAAIQAWVGHARRAPAFWIVWVLLLAQVPVIFMIERGNTDALVLGAWSLTFWLYQRRKPFLAGMTGAISVLIKVYPLFAMLVVGTGLLKARKIARRFFAGAAAGLGLGFLAAGKLSFTYFFSVLPTWSHATQFRHITAHSLDASFSNLPALVAVIQLVLLGTWLRRALLSFAKDPTFVFAGALAISTYFAKVTNDYNLITAYPLLILLFLRATTKPGEKNQGFTMLFGMLVIAGTRQLFSNPWINWVKFHTLLQVFWLCWVGWRGEDLSVPANQPAEIIGCQRPL